MKFIKFNKIIFFYAVFILIIPAASVAKEKAHTVINTDKVIKVGVRALKGTAIARKTWTKTINVLNENIKNYQFELIPILGFDEMRAAAKNKKVDFILTNPLAYTELNKQVGLTRILTINKILPNGVASNTFASVIFTRSDRSDINSLNDIHNKSIMGVHKEAFGGWKIALREFLDNGFDPHEDSSEILFSSDNTHQSVVGSVLNGQADVGVVRTGIIETLTEQGKIKPNSIKVLNNHKDNLSVLHSTQHYPEWPFSILPHVPSEISNKVFHALLSIQPESLSAIAGKYHSWQAPLDYSEVYNLKNELESHHLTFEKIWDKHWITIILFQVFVLAIIFYTFYLFSINKKLILSKLELSQHRDKLSQHRDQLEDIVTARTEELTAEKTKANDANKAKSEFLSNMSHELRTPLNAILGFSQLLQLQERENKNVSSNAGEIISAGEYLLSLINEILDLATIEAGKTKFNLEKVSCSNILTLSLDIISPLANQKNITINVSSPSECFVTADRKRLQQICINLLSNAVKYNKQDGDIEVVIEQVEQQLCKFSIKDSGLGIKPEFHHRVFQPFAREITNSDTTEGTGVGLVITKHLVEGMHGEIGFNSEYGAGTEFWVTLPSA